MIEKEFNGYQGENLSFELKELFFNPNDVTIEMEIRENKDKTSNLILDVSPYITKDSESIVVDIPPSETKSWSFDRAYYDMFKVDNDGSQTVILKGCLTLENQVTDT